MCTSSACLSVSDTCGRPAQVLWYAFTAWCVVRGAVNPADPISRLHGQFAGNLDPAREAATRNVGNFWGLPDRKTVFLWIPGVPMGPFVLLQALRSGIRSYEGGGGRTSMRSSCSIGCRIQWGRSVRVPVRLSQPCEWRVLLLLLLRPSVFFACVMTRKRAKSATVGDAGTGDHRRRPPGGGCRAGSACAGPSAGCWPGGQCAGCYWAQPRRFFSGLTSLAPAVLRDAALDIAQRLHGAPTQAFCPEGTPNVKPPGQHHLCSYKWRVVYLLGTVYLTLSRHCRHEGRHLPYVFVQGSLLPVVGVAHVFDP